MRSHRLVGAIIGVKQDEGFVGEAKLLNPINYSPYNCIHVGHHVGEILVIFIQSFRRIVIPDFGIGSGIHRPMRKSHWIVNEGFLVFVLFKEIEKEIDCQIFPIFPFNILMKLSISQKSRIGIARSFVLGVQ